MKAKLGQKLISSIRRLFGFLSLFAYSSILIPLFLAVFVATSFISSHDNNLHFDRFYMPVQLDKVGYNESVMIRQIMDKIHEIRGVAKSYGILYSETDLAADFNDFDIPVPGAGVSISTIINFLKEFFNIKPKSISGELVYLKNKNNLPLPKDDDKAKFSTRSVVTDDIFILTIRSQDVGVEVEEGTIDHLIQKSAEFIMKNMEPAVLALYYQSRKQFDKMEEVIHYVERKQPENFLAISYLIKSYLHYGLKDAEKAIYYAERALKEHEKDLFTLSNYAYLKYRNGDLNEALATYKKMIVIAPEKYVNMYAYMAQILIMQDKDDEAADALETAFSINSQYAGIFALKGVLLKKTDHPDEALHNFEIAKEIRPNIIEADPLYMENYQALIKDIQKTAEKREEQPE